MSLRSLVDRMGPQLGIDPIKIKVKVKCNARLLPKIVLETM